MKQKPVPCPAQTKDYCDTFHLINKGNRAEAKYDMAGKSRSHNWAPKLVFRLFNMAMNNTYIMYKELDARDGGKAMPMGRSMKELAHALCQRGESMRRYAPTHPAHLREMDRVDGHKKGTKIRKDRKSEVMMSPPKPTVAISRKGQLTRQQKRQWWRTHLPMPTAMRGKCCWERCPGIKKCKKGNKSDHTTQTTAASNAVPTMRATFMCATQ